MQSIVIPLEFFKAIGEKPAIIRILWVKWLAEYTEQIFKPDFVEQFYSEMNGKNIQIETIKEAYILGMAFFQDGFIFLKDEKKKTVYNPETLHTIQLVINHLNVTANATFTVNKANCACIAARIKEGYSISEFKRVIDKKASEWLKTSMQQFLRPITLFQSQKFENYLNEPEKIKDAEFRKKSNIERTRLAINKAKEPSPD
jgi:uncharacterized phage protein (TIGR02220 family)